MFVILTHDSTLMLQNREAIFFANKSMTLTAYFRVTTSSASLSLLIASTTSSAATISSPSKTRYSMSTSSPPTIGFARLMVSA